MAGPTKAELEERIEELEGYVQVRTDEVQRLRSEVTNLQLRLMSSEGRLAEKEERIDFLDRFITEMALRNSTLIVASATHAGGRGVATPNPNASNDPRIFR